jgi:hypothetical protein
MSTRRAFRISLGIAVVTLFAQMAFVSAQTPAPASPQQRDGQHDFDWIFGTWNGKLKRLQKPLTGSTTWVEYDCKQVTKRVFGGRAVMDEFTADSVEGHVHLEGLTIRLYNPESREWSIYWANMKNGALAMPPTVGRFQNGRGEFFDHEELEGRPIVVRYIWPDITPNSARFEQSFSPDDGKTWEVNWISTISRLK